MNKCFNKWKPRKLTKFLYKTPNSTLFFLWKKILKAKILLFIIKLKENNLILSFYKLLLANIINNISL